MRDKEREFFTFSLLKFVLACVHVVSGLLNAWLGLNMQDSKYRIPAWNFCLFTKSTLCPSAPVRCQIIQ